MHRGLGVFPLCVLLFASCFSWGKDFSTWRQHTQAELVSETTAFAPGAAGTVGLKIKLAPKWHTYWLNPGDSGTPIHLQFKTSRGVRVERVLFPIPEREQSGPLISFGYSGQVLLPIEVQIDKNILPGRTVSLNVDVEWLVCEDVCIPAFDSLHIDLPVVSLGDVQPSGEFALFQKTRSLIPELAETVPHYEFNREEVMLKIPQAVADEKFIDFFPFRGSGVTNVKAQLVGDVLQFEKSNVAAANENRVGVIVLRSKESGKLRAIQYGDSGWNFERAKEASSEGLLWMLVSAFIGGLILNLMPCVFPILSIKLLSLLKLARAHPKEVRLQNLAYVGGVLISFLTIALVLSVLRTAGHLIGWGFQLQSPVFLSLLSWLFFVLSLNLLGVYEFDVLNANWGHRFTRFGGMWGSFFTGVLAVIVASPCTAPFMGVALGFGLAQPTYILLLTFLMLGLGLAFPYLLFVIFPSLVKVMPRPGRWMQVLKQAMAFPMLLTTLWLLWILGQVRGVNSVMIVLAGCVALGFAFFLSEFARKVARITALIVLLSGVILIYNSESPLDRATQNSGGLWQNYSEARFASLKGQNIFINMTADWCLTCKVNERLVFDDSEVQALMHAKNVIWLKGDWTKRNEEVTRFLNRYDRVGVPFYVLYSLHNPGGTSLPEVLTKSKFIEYLNKEFP